MSRCSLVFLLLAACGGGGHGMGDAAGSGSDANGDGMPMADGAGPDANLNCPAPMTLAPITAVEVGPGGFIGPVFVAQPPGSTDLYVVEQPGRIKILRGSTILATPFLDVTADVNIPFLNAEGGLLGLEFKSDYVTTGRFFVYMTLAGPNRVAIREYHRSNGNHDVADPTPVAELLSVGHSGGNNVGGTLAFGPDGYLWVAPGDAAISPNSPASDVTSRLGKMLRVDVDNPGTPPPNGLGGSADPYVWDYGLRNPYRFSFDRLTHELYLADAGDTMWEEVNIEQPGVGHHDFGWDRMEGMHCHDGSMACGAPGTLPQFELAHNGFSVIIGGVVYRGAAIPSLRGRYIFGHYGVGEVLSWAWCGAQITSPMDLTNSFPQTLTNIVSFGQDNAGEIYMVVTDGHLYKIVPS